MSMSTTKSELVSKEEALNMLSEHLRKRGLPAATLIKLLQMYSKLSGWDLTNLENLLEDAFAEALLKRELKS